MTARLSSMANSSCPVRSVSTVSRLPSRQNTTVRIRLKRRQLPAAPGVPRAGGDVRSFRGRKRSGPFPGLTKGAAKGTGSVPLV